MLNNVEIIYTLDENGVQTALGKQDSIVNNVSVFFGMITGNLGFTGSSVIAMTREPILIEWASIKKAVMNGKQREISLSSERNMLVRLFCDPEIYPDAVKYIERMLPEVESKHI
jgi:hypothetical protein